MKKRLIVSTLSQFCENSDLPRRLLEESGFEVRENKTGRRIRSEEMSEALKEADGVIAAVEPYEAQLLQSLPQLKCISRCGAGCDAIDLEAARENNIEVMVTRDEIVEPVAQLTIAMMLGLARNFAQHACDFSQGLWKKHTAVLISEWSVGLVGFGKIGRRVADYLRPFGPRLLVTDPYAESESIPEEVTLCDLERLLKESDCVSLHASTNPNDPPLLGRKEFALMKQGGVIVNTARGYMIDHLALEEALFAGRLKGAALDVFDREPYAGRLAKHPSVLLTPHVATLTKKSRIAMEVKAAQNIIDFFDRLERT